MITTLTLTLTLIHTSRGHTNKANKATTVQVGDPSNKQVEHGSIRTNIATRWVASVQILLHYYICYNATNHAACIR